MLFGDWCCSRLHKPRAPDSLTPRLESKPLPPEEFWCLHQKHGLMNPRGNKGTKYKLSEKTCLHWEAETVSALEQTRFQTGVIKVGGTLYCVGHLIFHFTFMWSQLRWYAFNLKLLCPIFLQQKKLFALAFSSFTCMIFYLLSKFLYFDFNLIGRITMLSKMD